jgi:subtilisin family serine protease
MHGFAVQLTDDEARRMSGATGVVAMYEDRPVHLHTTRSPGFLGLDSEFGAWRDTSSGDGVIISIVDTGIWPESPSFDDSGLGPVRSSWRGTCIDAGDFNASLCNNKLVGARAFDVAGRTGRGVPSPRDHDGHGTHVGSTAAGSEVRNIGIGMFARGTARGTAPKAKIAMYKINNFATDTVAAIDAAVKDGVDIISISLLAYEMRPFYNNILAIATFGVERAGVVVVIAGGNSGPRASTVDNAAPWVTTVGASTVDRLFPAKLHLGDGTVLTGQSLYNVKTNRTAMVPLSFYTSCYSDSDPTVPTPDLNGKILACVLRDADGGHADNNGRD